MKFEQIRQLDAMQCGVACLQIVCSFYGRDYSADLLSKICYATTEGVSMLDIKEAANMLGFNTMCARVEIKDLYKASGPCILYWNQNHFVVLLNIKKNQFFNVMDPAKGRVVYSLEEFRQHWISESCNGREEGIVMFMETTSSFYTYKVKKENIIMNDNSFHFFFDYVKKYRKLFIQIIIGLLLSCLLQLVLPFLTQSIVDVGIKKQDVGFVWLVLIGQFVLVVSSTLVDFIRRWLLLHISLRINLSLLSDFFIKLLSLPMSFFDTKLMGDLMQRMNDHDRVNNFLTQQALSIAFALLTFSVFSVVLFLYSKFVFVLFFVGSILYGIWLTLFLKRRRLLDYDLFEQQAINNNMTYEFITSIQEIKLQGCEQRRRWKWENIQTDLFDLQMKSLKLQQVQEAGGLFINEIKNVIIVIVSATSVIHNEMTLGMMLAVQYIIGQLNSPVEQLMLFIYSLQDVRISVERINEIHRLDDENGKHGLCKSLSGLESGISIKNVRFKYDPHAFENVLDDININIPLGKMTAIVGASGSGKTTLIRLMLGYYNTLNGIIEIGNVDINFLDKQWWRHQCGVVMQDGVIFSDSIARNIAVDDERIDSKRLYKAAEIACIKEFVLALPLKFNTMIGHDGMGLSQGQKQRILIARAVYKNPSFIFFDEATNSLDANNEKKIVENLSQFYEGKTVVVVAHRLSTVLNANQIIVLNHGHVVEVGNHRSLIAKRGAYYQLIKNQLELGN